MYRGSLLRSQWDDIIDSDPGEGEFHGNAIAITQQATKYARTDGGPVIVVAFDWNCMVLLDFYPRQRSANRPPGEVEPIFNDTNAPARIYWTRGVKGAGGDADITTGFGEALLGAMIMALKKRGFLTEDWP